MCTMLINVQYIEYIERMGNKKMKTYIGTESIDASPMTRGEYNKYRGWTIPENENPNEDGYLVVYEGDYESYSPKEVFEKSYRECGGLTFGIALELLKKGIKVTRKGWNGKGLFVVYQKAYPKGIPCNMQTAAAWNMQEGELFKCEPYLQINTVSGSHAMWVPSINDCLAADWMVVE